MRTKAIRIVVVVVCIGGVAGMIVTSATDHNGAAITFGIITAVAILCQMAVTTALNEATGAPSAPLDPRLPAPATPLDAEAAALEHRIEGLVADGAQESAVRDLVRQAVHLGRLTSTSAPPDL